MKNALLILVLLLTVGQANATQVPSTVVIASTLDITAMTSEEACLEMIAENDQETDETVDQCMDQAY